MNTELSIPLCTFNFSGHQDLHSNCLSELCIKKRGHVCITPKMQRHIEKHTKASSDIKEFPGIEMRSDWAHLMAAIERPRAHRSDEMLDYFARTHIYRLRFLAHRNDGIAFINRLIAELKTFFRTFGSIWGTQYASHEHVYTHFFNELCSKCERSSVGGIYRLFDLFEGDKYSLEQTFPNKLHLALLFAFGHGSSKNPNLSSISQLVAKFQFYLEFAKHMQKKTLATLKPNQQIQELASEKFGEIAQQLWKGYISAAVIIQSNQNNTLAYNRRIITSLEELYDQQGAKFQTRSITYQLKSDLSKPLVLPAFSCSPSLQNSRFDCEFSAAYHPFKHQDTTQRFFGDEVSTPSIEEFRSWKERDFARHAHDAMQAYCNVIKGIIQESPLPSVQPAQFDSGENCRFTVNKPVDGRMHAFSVLAAVYPHGISYTLTCLDSRLRNRAY